MSRTASRRLLAQSPFTPFSDFILNYRIPTRCLQSFSSSPRRRAEEDDQKLASIPLTPAPKPRSPAPSAAPVSPSLHAKATSSGMEELSKLMSLSGAFKANQASRTRQKQSPQLLDTNFASDGTSLGGSGQVDTGLETSWQLHIYATRHNVHITLVRPPGWIHPQTGRRYPKAPGTNRTVAMSLAAGNLGFRHAGRKHYDSAFQLASYVFGRMQESGLNAWIGSLEVYLRGFGTGREAVTKALLGTEGRYLRGKVIKVSDATRLKFGGTRSPKPRRLG